MKRLTGIVVAGLLSCGYAGAQGPMRGEMHGMAPQGIDRETIITRVLNSPETAAKVGLSKEQVEKLKSVQFEFQKKEVALKADAETAKLDMQQAMSQEKVDKAAALKAFDKVAEKETALRRAGMEHMLDMKEIAGPEVVKKVQDMIRERMSRSWNKAEQPGQTQTPRGDAPVMQQRGNFRGMVPQQGGESRPWLRQQIRQPRTDAPPAAAPAPKNEG